MKFRSRVFLHHLRIPVPVLFYGVLPSALHRQGPGTVSGESLSQPRRIGFALSRFIGEAPYDVLAVSLNDTVQTGRARQSEGTGPGFPIAKSPVTLKGSTPGGVREPGRGSTSWFTVPELHGEHGNP